MTSTYGLYAYGLVDNSPGRLDIVGIDRKHRVYPVHGRDMCVMVSDIDIDQFQNQVKTLFSELTTAQEPHKVLLRHYCKLTRTWSMRL